jgi:uncharacterized protein YndB with AHSA1/START domain
MTPNKSTATTHKTEFTTPTDREVVATRRFDAPRQLVWDCFTKPEHIQKWLLGPDGWTMPVCEVDLRKGGKWRWVWQKSDGGERMEMHGEYLEVTAPERLVNTENWGQPWPETTNTQEFTEEDGTTLTVATVRYPSKEARDKAIETGMEDGWGRSYERLDEYLQK